jgi:hypothetical protein
MSSSGSSNRDNARFRDLKLHQKDHPRFSNRDSNPRREPSSRTEKSVDLEKSGNNTRSLVENQKEREKAIESRMTQRQGKLPRFLPVGLLPFVIPNLKGAPCTR